MSAEKQNIEERILVTMAKYSFRRKEIVDDECRHLIENNMIIF
jgi:hypothetical protein